MDLQFIEQLMLQGVSGEWVSWFEKNIYKLKLIDSDIKIIFRKVY